MSKYLNKHNITFHQMQTLLERINNLLDIKNFEQDSITDYILGSCGYVFESDIVYDNPLVALSNPLMLVMGFGFGNSIIVVDFSELSPLSTDKEIVSIAMHGIYTQGIEVGSDNVKSQLMSLFVR